MVKEITTYPTPTGFNFGGSVAHFDDTLHSLITDLKDTMEANHLEGLSAFEIGSPLNVIVIKQQEHFLEMINPIIFTKEGEIHPTETTAYYGNISAVTTRAKHIKLTYDDIEGKQQFMSASDDLAVVIQRTTDYLLGSTFIARLSNDEKKIFENKLKGFNESDARDACNLAPFSDKILLAIKYAIIVGLIGVIGAFFDGLLPYVQLFEHYLMLTIALLIGSYFIRAIYEGKRCGVCQLGNSVAVMVMKSIHLGGLYLLNSWLVF